MPCKTTWTLALTNYRAHLQTGAGDDKDSQVVLECVARLNPVLEEERAAHHVIQHIVFNEQVVRVVHVHGSVEAVMHAAATHVRAGHVAVQVEVDGVAAESERLTRVGELDVFQSADDQSLVRPWSV